MDHIFGPGGEFTARYPSAALRPNREEFRLLCIWPGEWIEPIECTLHTTSLQKRPEYEALSYSWGSALKKRTVSLNGSLAFPVTDNAFDALRRLRRTESMRYIWLDAVCINQNDLDERRQQVAIMGKIYRMSRRCIVWLGEDAEDEDGALVQTLCGEDSLEHPWDILVNLQQAAGSPWWERTWVVQEVILSGEVTVCFGPYRIEWRIFCDELVGVGVEHRELRFLIRYSISPELKARITGVDHLRKAYQQGKQASLVEVLVSMGGLLCTDKRDRIYGCLGFMEQQTASLINIDYSVSYIGVYANATRACIVATRSLQILAFARFREPEAEQNMSTWIVDFEKIGSDRSLLGTDFAEFDVLDKQPGWADEQREVRQPPKRSRFARLSTLFKANSTPGISFDSYRYHQPDDPALLSVRGFCLDQVAAQHCLTDYIWNPQSGADAPNGEIHEIRLSRVVEAYGKVTRSLTSHNGLLEPSRPSFGLDSTVTTPAQNLLPRVSKSVIEAAISTTMAPWTQTELGSTSIAKYMSYGIGHFGDAYNLALFSTEGGFLGVALSCIEAGDVVALLHGSMYPALLRPDGDHFTFQGFCYVHGIMDGELNASDVVAKLVEQEFILK